MKFSFLFLIFLIGCSNPESFVVYETIETDVCLNDTITIFNESIRYVNETVYVNETIYINTSCRFEDDYVLDLIRRVKFLENRLDDNFNITYEDNLYDCRDELKSCNETLEDLKDVLED